MNRDEKYDENDYIEFSDPCVQELENCINDAPISKILDSGEVERLLEEELIDRIDNLKIYIYAGDHPPPHFHVRAGQKDLNRYRIDNGEPFPNGTKISKTYKENIKNWYNNKYELLDLKWQELNPKKH